MATTTKFIEGVPYTPFLLRFRGADGKPKRRVLWSPGLPWLREEVSRYLIAHDVPKGSTCTIRSLS